MHMIDTLICIVYIFVGAKWVLKKVEIEMISAPTNWKIIVLKFLIWLVVPLEIFIYIHFYDSEYGANIFGCECVAFVFDRDLAVI